MNIIIINITLNWVYKLYQEYIFSIKKFIINNYNNINVEIKTFDISQFNLNEFNNINFDIYNKILYSGDINILNLIVQKYNFKKIYFINIEQMSHHSYYKLIRNIDLKINIIDYSEENIPYFENIYKTYLFPPYFEINNINYKDKNIDVLSIINNNYREDFFKNISFNDKINIKIINNCYDNIRDDFFSKTKIYINIHCSEEHKTMELIRIVNLIFNKVIIISQKSVYTDLLFLKKYILVCNSNDFLNYTNEILNNYDFYFNYFYGDIDLKKNEYYQYIKNNVDKIIYH